MVCGHSSSKRQGVVNDGDIGHGVLPNGTWALTGSHLWGDDRERRIFEHLPPRPQRSSAFLSEASTIKYSNELELSGLAKTIPYKNTNINIKQSKYSESLINSICRTRSILLFHTHDTFPCYQEKNPTTPILNSKTPFIKPVAQSPTNHTYTINQSSQTKPPPPPSFPSKSPPFLTATK